MAIITRKGQSVETIGELPQPGTLAPDFSLTLADLSEITLTDLLDKGKMVVLNIFPSIDTPTCARSVHEFNLRAATAGDRIVVCVSADLPFAQSRFCGAEGIDNVITGSSFRSDFGKVYGAEFITGPLTGLLSRAIVVIGVDGSVRHTQQVADTSQEPDYLAALQAQ